MDNVILENEIDQAFTGNDLKAVYDRFFSTFIQQHTEAFNTDSIDLQSLERVSIPKKLLVKVVATVFSNLPLLGQWVETLSEPVFQALKRVSWQRGIEVGDLERSIGGSVLESTKGKKNRARLKDSFCLFQLQFFKSVWGAEGNRITIDIPAVFRTQLKKVLPEPKGLSLDEVPELSNIKADFEDNGRILNALPLISRFIEQGDLEMTKQGTPKTKSLQRLKEICDLREFYDKHPLAELSCMRTRMVVELFLRIGDQAVSGNSAVFLRQFFDMYQDQQVYAHSWFFSHVKGMYHCRELFNRRMHRNSWNLLCSLPENRWLTVKQLYEFVCLSSLDLAPVERKSADRYLYITTEWQGWGNKKRYITPQYYENVLVLPSLKAILFLFASFGLLDLITRLPENKEVVSNGKPYLTIFDGLEAVRLTDFGAFVTRKRGSPVQPAKEEAVAFDLDADRLFITFSGSDQLAGMSLERFASRIGPHLFRVDAGSFLKGCKGRQDLIDKITVFNKEISDNPPSRWQQFFDQLISRADVFVPVADTLVFKLSPSSREDLDLIAGDRILKRYISKAEGRHILVKQENIERVKNRLEELGYLM